MNKIMQTSMVLIAVMFFLCLKGTESTETLYSREFQLQINFDEFNEGRDVGTERYFNYFAQVAGISLDEELPEHTQSIREEISIDADSCKPQGFFSQRNNVWGDLEGLKVTQVKTTGALSSSSEALDEPFEVSSKYSPDTILYIEYDIHACEADWSATSRIFLDNFPKIETCKDLHNIFPEAVSSSSSTITYDSDGYVYSDFRNGTYLGGMLTLDMVLNYRTYDDALNDENLQGGEFSFTMYAADQVNGDWSNEQDQMAIEIYQSMLDEFGSGDEYPCDPPVDIADLVEDDNNDNTESNANDDNNNSSDASILIPSFFALIFALLL